jgi:tRNA(fMet)-specific endonuclease VapC
MAGKTLLDTNIVIALLERHRDITNTIAEYDEAFVSEVVLGELFFGAFRSTRVQANLIRIEEFCEGRVVLGLDRQVARVYGEVKQGLRANGRPIPDNDLWIAATAIRHQVALTTRDQLFAGIAALDVTFL